MTDNYLTLKDPNGRLLTKVLRSSNRLYKLRFEVGRPVCLLTRMEKNTWRWQVRLGYISFKTIRFMATQEIVHGLPEIRRSFEIGKKTKSKTMRACIRPKINNIVLIKQY